MSDALASLLVPSAWLDENGHMNLMWWTHLYDRAAARLLLAWNMDGTRRGGFAVESRITYAAEAAVGDLIEVHAVSLEFGRSSFALGLRCRLGDRTLGEAALRLVCVDMATRRATPLDEAQRESMGRYAATLGV